MKRGVPTMPSEIIPPRMGTLTMKALFTLLRINNVLNMRTAVNPVKIAHSLLEKEEKTKLICVFVGNLKLRMRLYKFSIEEILK